MSVKIAPSLLAADLSCLRDDIERAHRGGCDTFHVDIMDAHFVPNLSYGPSFVATVRRLTGLPLDVHLMMDNPHDMIGPFADAGSDYITVHIEVTDDVADTIGRLRDAGVKPGLTLKPGTPVDSVLPWLGDIDLLLVMSVHPGFGGQAFIGDSYARIERIADTARTANPSLLLSVDGGVGIHNAGALARAGANYLVAGTAVFRDHAAAENIPALREAAHKGPAGAG